MDSKKVEIYLKIRGEIDAQQNEALTVGKLAEVVAPVESKEKIEQIVVIKVQPQMDEVLVVSALDLVKKIQAEFPQAKFNMLGEEEVLVKLAPNKNQGQAMSIILLICVCFFLFVGSALAIMNFHADVDMKEVHGEIYHLLTGKKVEHPLMLQIPYSLGIGLGMALFFGFISKKSKEKDPSPLELEMRDYEEKVHNYILNKKQKSEKDKEGG